jgi:hypothetical protein
VDVAQPNARKYIEKKGQQPRRFGNEAKSVSKEDKTEKEVYEKPPAFNPDWVNATSASPDTGTNFGKSFGDNNNNNNSNNSNNNNNNDPFFLWLKELGLEELHTGLIKAGIKTKLALSFYDSKDELLTEMQKSGFPNLTLAQAGVLFRAAKK